MPDCTELRVGSVVARGRRRVGVVVDLSAGHLLVAPALRWQQPAVAGDVRVEAFADIVLLRGRVADGVVVRLSMSAVVPRSGQCRVGELTEATVTWLRHVRARLTIEAAALRRWSAAQATFRRHLVGESCVRL